MPGKWLTSAEQAKCFTLHQHAGWGYTRIAKCLGISRSSVRRAVAHPETPPRPQGRKPTCNTSKRQQLVRQATSNAENRRLTFEQDARRTGLPFSKSTLRRAFRKQGYFRRIARKKPFLTEEHKAKRLEWARQHVEWSDRQWSRVLWTDKASIRCGFFGQVYVTRRNNEAFHEDCLIARFRNYLAVMIWASISLDRPRDMLVFDAGSINSARYINKVLPIVNKLAEQHKNESIFQQTAIFQQDNAPIHTSRVTQHALNQAGIAVLDWPANSPDLNPIENMWALLKRRVSYHFPTTKAEVEAAVRIE